MRPLPSFAIAACAVACGGGPHLTNLRCRDASRCNGVEDPLKLHLAVDFEDGTKTLSEGALELRLGGQTQRAVSLLDAFVAQGIARDATRGTLLIDDVLLLDRVTNGEEVTVGFLATNGNGQESNEADAKFTLRLGAAP
ncbi:MAG: hypothetical protein ACJ783_13025 [Myxococcales bacterium]